MLVKEIMSTNPSYLSPQASLTEAATFLRDYHYGFAPIGDENEIFGVITDRDLAIRAMASGWDQSSQVKDFMTKDVVYCYEGDDIKQAVELMRSKQIHRLIVLNNPNDKKPVGVLSLSDLAKKCDNKLFSWKIAQCSSETLH